MADKVIINIVYAPPQGPPNKIFENEKGEIWNSQGYDNSKINIGMGWYSIQDPKPVDSILVVEPYCVLQRDYSTEWTKKFKYIFTWANKGFKSSVQDKIIDINHPTYHSFPDPNTVGNDGPYMSPK